MTRLRAVLFDLDDTLFDHAGSVSAALRDWITASGGTPTDELLARWFTIERIHFDSWLAGEISHAEQRRRRLRDFLPLIGRPVPADAPGLDAAHGAFLRVYERTWRAFDDARPALELVRGLGLRIGVLTNGERTQQRAKLDRTGLAGLVDVIRTSDELGIGKPAPESFRITCADLGVEPAQALMVGDNPRVDVDAARAAGLSAVHLNRPAGDTLPALLTSALASEEPV